MGSVGSKERALSLEARQILDMGLFDGLALAMSATVAVEHQPVCRRAAQGADKTDQISPTHLFEFANDPFPLIKIEIMAAYADPESLAAGAQVSQQEQET